MKARTVEGGGGLLSDPGSELRPGWKTKQLPGIDYAKTMIPGRKDYKYLYISGIYVRTRTRAHASRV